MPVAGNGFTVTLKRAHLGWGIVGPSRQGGRKRHYMEAYIPIRLPDAKKFNIFTGVDYDAVSADGFINARVKASGSTGPNNAYAKQFAGLGNLKLLGYWLKGHCKASVGDQVHVEFLSSTKVMFTFIRLVPLGSGADEIK